MPVTALDRLAGRFTTRQTGAAQRRSLRGRGAVPPNRRPPPWPGLKATGFISTHCVTSGMAASCCQRAGSATFAGCSPPPQHSTCPMRPGACALSQPDDTRCARPPALTSLPLQALWSPPRLARCAASTRRRVTSLRQCTPAGPTAVQPVVCAALWPHKGHRVRIAPLGARTGRRAAGRARAAPSVQWRSRRISRPP